MRERTPGSWSPSTPRPRSSPRCDASSSSPRVAVPQAIVFDLGGTLVHWPDWDEGATVKWSVSYDHLIATYPERRWPARESFVAAMRDAEAAHWKRVDEEHWSGPPTGLVREGFDRP